jgi:RHS repeat-associated protein
LTSNKGTNQIAESYSYNAQTGLFDNQTVTRGATTLLNLSYDYANSSGKRTGQLTKLLNNLDHNKDRGYSYDALGRLVQATGGPSSSTLSTQTYTYDRYGNRTSVSASGYSAKNGSAGAGSANGSPALSAQNQRGSSPTVREGANTIAQPTDPRIELPTELLAKNNSVALPANGGSPTVREGSSAVSDSSTSLFKPSTTKTNTTAPTDPPSFTNSPLTAGVEIKAIHITELRDAINALRARVGRGSYSWSESVTSGVFIKADHILEMRTALNEAIGAPSGGYAAGLAQGQPILGVHIQELRDRVLAAWNGNSSCPQGQTLLIDQFVKNFYQATLARQPNASELQSWTDQLRQAYYQGQSQLLSVARYMGRQIFKSPEYIARNRDDHWFAYDLYKAYLQREPDQQGWDFWTAQVTANGRDNVRIAFEVCDEFINKVATLCPGGSAGSAPIPIDGLANVSYDPATNRIITAGFQYDASGNQTRIVRADGSAQRFQYDAANRLIQVKDDYGYTLQTITYGDSNERLISNEGGYRTYYAGEGGSTVAEYFEVGSSTTPAWSKSYVYLGARLLSTLTPNGNGGEAVQYHHPDRLGTRLITDPSNGTSFEQVMLPFGTALTAESTGATNRRFTSYDRSTTTGLDYAVNRHYDSQQGRFTQVDPAGMKATSLANPQTLNLYAYCANDPINRTDSNGLGFFSFLKKAFNWIKSHWKIILVAVVVVVAVLLIPGAPGLLSSFFQKVGVIITGGGAAEGGGISTWLKVVLGGVIAAGVFGLGSYLQNRQVTRSSDPLQDALNRARKALKRKACRELFGSQANKVQKLLEDFAKGKAGVGTIRLADLGGVRTDPITGNQSITFAETRPISHVGPGGGLIFDGVSITLNNNPAINTSAGYGGRFGVSNNVNRAISLVHELAHAVDILSGSDGTTKIPDDTGNPDLSKENSQRVYDACFK